MTNKTRRKIAKLMREVRTHGMLPASSEAEEVLLRQCVAAVGSALVTTGFRQYALAEMTKLLAKGAK